MLGGSGGAGGAPLGGRTLRLCAALRHCGSALIRGGGEGGEVEEEEEKLLWLLCTLSDGVLQSIRASAAASVRFPESSRVQPSQAGLSRTPTHQAELVD